MLGKIGAHEHPLLTLDGTAANVCKGLPFEVGFALCRYDRYWSNLVTFPNRVCYFQNFLRLYSVKIPVVQSFCVAVVGHLL